MVIEAQDILEAATSPVVDGMVGLSPREWTWDDVKAMARFSSEAHGEWAGAPIPCARAPLILEPRYPFTGLHGLKLDDGGTLERVDVAARPASADWPELRNHWYSYHRGGHVYVYRHDNGKSRCLVIPEGAGRRLRFWIDTLGVAASQAWDVKTEARACEKLASLVTPHAMNCYTLSGSFLETSRRSGVTYLFRKLRPTLALRPDRSRNMEVISVLCLHPLGYYGGTWAGVMCPTDDVVAHLVLMRGDEHGFWRKANHHEMWMATAGI